MTVSQLYEREIKPLPEAERLQLASQILLDITAPPVIDDSDVWTEEDLRDFSRASLSHIERRLQEEENAQVP